jgi:hypothetical protein
MSLEEEEAEETIDAVVGYRTEPKPAAAAVSRTEPKPAAAVAYRTEPNAAEVVVPRDVEWWKPPISRFDALTPEGVTAAEMQEIRAYPVARFDALARS